MVLAGELHVTRDWFIKSDTWESEMARSWSIIPRINKISSRLLDTRVSNRLSCSVIDSSLSVLDLDVVTISAIVDPYSLTLAANLVLHESILAAITWNLLLKPATGYGRSRRQEPTVGNPAIEKSLSLISPDPIASPIITSSSAPDLLMGLGVITDSDWVIVDISIW